MAFRVLCFDGGGVRGVYTATLLRRLRALVPDLVTAADLLAGTSTGGIIALGLAKGLTPRDLELLYLRNARDIFKPRFLGGTLGPKYDNVNLRKVLLANLGTTTLGRLPKKVLIPAFDLGRDGHQWKPKFFTNYQPADCQELVLDVATRTSSAPTFFPQYQGFIDGGVVANNPSMCALTQALNSGRAADEIRLLSFGCGGVMNSVQPPQRAAGWGLVQWASQLLNVMLDGDLAVADYQCSRILGPRYHRLAPQIREDIPLDAANRVEELAALAEQVELGPTVDWLTSHWASPATS